MAEVASEDLSPEQNTAWSAFARRLDSVLDELKESYRQAFELAVVQQRSYAEVAQLTGWTLPQVKINVYRARQTRHRRSGRVPAGPGRNVMNESCEIFEASLSAFLDGELEVPEQLPTIDHLLECPSCQEFYRQARGVGDMVVSSRSQAADPVPEEIWHRIEAESGMSGKGRSRGWAEVRNFPRWGLQLAAVVLLGLGLWVAPAQRCPVAFGAPGREPTQRRRA